MLYEKFAASELCTIRFQPGEEGYAAARELAEDICRAYRRQRNVAQKAPKYLGRDEDGEPIENIDPWDELCALETLLLANPNAVALLKDENDPLIKIV